MALTLRIIPVLDLKGEVVVRARAGVRDEYRPIETPLSTSADPVSVAEGLRGLYPFDTFYCADLDAIVHGAPNQMALNDLCAMAGAPEIWLDAGFDSNERLGAALAIPQIRVVLGTESQVDMRLSAQFAAHPRVILSLDFFADGYRGPRAMLDSHELWPSTVIVMTLARVGVSAGPDLELLRAIKQRAGKRAVVAAGGVRNAEDIETLKALGLNGVLIATALHSGAITRSQLAEFR